MVKFLLRGEKKKVSCLLMYHINKTKLYTRLFKEGGRCGLLMDKLIKSVNAAEVTKYTTYQNRN